MAYRGSGSAGHTRGVPHLCLPLSPKTSRGLWVLLAEEGARAGEVEWPGVRETGPSQQLTPGADPVRSRALGPGPSCHAPSPPAPSLLTPPAPEPPPCFPHRAPWPLLRSRSERPPNPPTRPELPSAASLSSLPHPFQPPALPHLLHLLLAARCPPAGGWAGGNAACCAACWCGARVPQTPAQARASAAPV